MNLGELRSALDTERQKGGLQQLRDSFYQEVADYVEERKTEREELADEVSDPFASSDIQRLTDEIETAKGTAESLYERRLGKLVKQASLAAADMANPDQVEGLTTEERELYDDLVGRIEANKAHMLDVVAGEATGTPGGDVAAAGADGNEPAADPAPSRAEAQTGAPPDFDPDPAVDQSESATVDTADADAAATPDDRDDPAVTAAEARAIADDAPTDSATDGVSAADVMGASPDDAVGGSEPTPAADSGPATDDAPGEPAREEPPEVDRTTVRITQDVGDIFGVDEREYKLASDDVVTLPSANADPLVERDAAEKLE
ncbi:hypothetical protein [Haloarchaeobius sp. DFWS5]|uniref:hypothetical protein n=1 Tax=Haloarchaeobius sp. DFWS5 TaxID=3446114 RepID=UPI003EBBB245